MDSAVKVRVFEDGSKSQVWPYIPGPRYNLDGFGHEGLQLQNHFRRPIVITWEDVSVFVSYPLEPIFWILNMEWGHPTKITRVIVPSALDYDFPPYPILLKSLHWSYCWNSDPLAYSVSGRWPCTSPIRAFVQLRVIIVQSENTGIPDWVT